MTRIVERSEPDGKELPLQSLVDLIPDAVFFHGFDGRFLYINDAARSLLGYVQPKRCNGMQA